MCGSQSADISMVERRFHVPARRHRLSAKTALNERGLTGHLISTSCASAAVARLSSAVYLAPSVVAPMSMLYRDGEHLGSELRLQNLARSGSLAAQHGLEHHAGDVSLQAAARLPAAHPLGALALHVGDRRRMHTRP